MRDRFYVASIQVVITAALWLSFASVCLGESEVVVPTDVLRTQTPVYEFSSEDEQLLDAIQRGCFNYLWSEVGVPGRLAKDRRTTLVASLAGVGFQLSSLPIAIERGWITHEQGEQRALRILRTLRKSPGNRRDGLFLHFVNADDGTIYPPYRNEISTVDHSLFLAGAMPAGTYFGGETAELTDRFIAETNWRSFQRTDTGRLSFAWKLEDSSDVNGQGHYVKHQWQRAADEDRLIYFLAAGCPTERFAVEPNIYYELDRPFGRLGDGPPFVVSWNGALFTYFFSHCWINYRDLGPDEPSLFGVEAPRVDWWENSRRATHAHRQACLNYADQFKSFGENRWGLSPCMGQPKVTPGWGYLVPALRPNLSGNDRLHRGTIAPYAAGSAIMFTPSESVAALREFCRLRDARGEPLVWRDPTEGGYAFADSFNLDQQVACDDNVAIDVGPMLLAIENARTGLIWRLFMDHPSAERAAERLKFN